MRDDPTQETCPVCAAAPGEACWDLRAAGDAPWRRTLKPHPARRPPATRTRGVCPVCSREIALQRNGTIYVHARDGAVAFDGRRLISNTCPGAGRFPDPVETPDAAREAGLSGWNLRCNRCGSYGARWIPGERPGWHSGNLCLCEQHANELEAEYRRHSAALEKLRAVRYEQGTGPRS